MTPCAQAIEGFFTGLDAQLGESRGPNGEPSASDFSADHERDDFDGVVAADIREEGDIGHDDA